MSHAALIVSDATKTGLMEKYALPGNLTQEDYYLWDRFDKVGYKYISTFRKAMLHVDRFYCAVILHRLLIRAGNVHHDEVLVNSGVKLKKAKPAAQLDLPPAVLAKIAAEAAQPARTGPPYYRELAETAKASRDAAERTRGAEMEACLRHNGMWEGDGP